MIIVSDDSNMGYRVLNLKAIKNIDSKPNFSGSRQVADKITNNFFFFFFLASSKSMVEIMDLESDKGKFYFVLF